MKTLKKLLALLLALAMVFCLFACGSSDDDEDEDDDERSSNVDDEDEDEEDEDEDEDKKKDDEDEDEDEDEDKKKDDDEDEDEDKKKDDDEDEDEDKKKDDEDEEEESDEDMIIGEWVYRIDCSDAITEMIVAELGEDSLSVDSALYMNLSFDFDKDTFVLGVEIDQDSLEEYFDVLIDELIDYMIEMAEAEGMTQEDLEEALGASLEEYFEEEMAAVMEDAVDEMSYEEDPMYYEIDAKKGRIYIAEDEEDLEDSEDYMEYTIKGNKLIIEKVVEYGEELEELDLDVMVLEMPWEFKKQ